MRVGLAGCGKTGQKYLQAIVHLTEAELVAVFDTNFDMARRAALAFEVPAYDTLDTMLRAVQLDGIIVTSPTASHGAIALTAVAHGVSVLVEQPMALTLPDAVAMVEKAKAAGVILAEAHSARLLPAVQQVVRAVHSDRLGTVVQAHAQVVAPRSDSYYQEAPWRLDPARSGGLVFSEAIAIFDVLISLLGPVKEIYARANHAVYRRPGEDVLSVQVEFQSGSLATLNATTVGLKASAEERLTLVGTQGAAVVGPTLQSIQSWAVDGDDEESVRRRLMELPARTSWQSSWDALDDFVGALDQGGTPVLAAFHGLDTVAAAEAVERSVESESVVHLASA